MNTKDDRSVEIEQLLQQYDSEMDDLKANHRSFLLRMVSLLRDAEDALEAHKYESRFEMTPSFPDVALNRIKVVIAKAKAKAKADI